MSEENTAVEFTRSDTCVVSQLVGAVQLVRFLRNQAHEEMHEAGQSFDQFVAHFIEHGGTEEDFGIVMGGLDSDEDEDDDDEEDDEPEEPGMSREEFTKLMQ